MYIINYINIRQIVAKDWRGQMTVTEFIEILRNSLVGEIPDYEIEDNLRFYENYIRNESINKKEEDVLEQLGNPRLIAKTIIDTYQISHGPIYDKMRNNRAYQDNDTFNDGSYAKEKDTYYENVDDDKNKYNENYDNSKKHYDKGDSRIYNVTLNWIQKLVFIIILTLVIILFFFIGAIVIRLLFSLIIPIFIIYLAIKIFRNVNK